MLINLFKKSKDHRYLLKKKCCMLFLQDHLHVEKNILMQNITKLKWLYMHVSRKRMAWVRLPLLLTFFPFSLENVSLLAHELEIHVQTVIGKNSYFLYGWMFFRQSEMGLIKPWHASSEASSHLYGCLRITMLYLLVPFYRILLSSYMCVVGGMLFFLKPTFLSLLSLHFYFSFFLRSSC